MDFETEKKKEHEVLCYIKSNRLPEKVDPDSTRVWSRAILRVLKADGSESFAIAKTIDGSRFRVIKDFGTVAPIVKYLEIRPFEYILEQFMPDVTTREELIDFLVNIHGENNRERIDNMNPDDLKALVYRVAMDMRDKDKDEYLNIKKTKRELKEKMNPKPLNEEDPEIEERKQKLAEYQKKAAQDERKRRNTRKKTE